MLLIGQCPVSKSHTQRHIYTQLESYTGLKIVGSSRSIHRMTQIPHITTAIVQNGPKSPQIIIASEINTLYSPPNVTKSNRRTKRRNVKVPRHFKLKKKNNNTHTFKVEKG